MVWVEDAQLLAGLHEAGDEEVAGEGEHVPRPLGPPQRHVPGPPHLVSTNKHCVGEEDWVLDSAVKRSIGSTTGCTITEKAPTRAFSWLRHHLRHI